MLSQATCRICKRKQGLNRVPVASTAKESPKRPRQRMANNAIGAQIPTPDTSSGAADVCRCCMKGAGIDYNASYEQVLCSCIARAFGSRLGEASFERATRSVCGSIDHTTIRTAVRRDKQGENTRSNKHKGMGDPGRLPNMWGLRAYYERSTSR